MPLTSYSRYQMDPPIICYCQDKDESRHSDGPYDHQENIIALRQWGYPVQLIHLIIIMQSSFLYTLLAHVRMPLHESV